MDVNAFDVTVGAALLPPAIAVINQWHWSAQLKGLAALLVCALYALGITIVRGRVHWDNWRDVLLTVAGAAFVAYRVWWQPSGIAPAIEAATTAGTTGIGTGAGTGAGPRPAGPVA